MSARMPADVIATALVASYRFGGKDPRDLLGPSPSVTLLADAALVIASHYGVRTSMAARLCCLGRPHNLVAQKMALVWACAKRDRRQAAIEAALKVIAPPPSAAPAIVTISHISKPSAEMVARQLSTLRAAKAPQDGLGTGPVAVAPPAKPECVTLTVPARQFGKTQADRLARQKSWAPSPIDLPPIPPVVCGTKWTRDYIAERERIKALYRTAGRKVPS